MFVRGVNPWQATLDGSPYGVFFSPSQSGRSTKWTISIEGGGWCYNEASCLARSKGALGTSKAWPKTMPFSTDPFGIHFRQWEMGCMNAVGTTLDMDCNAIYLPYGDGASFSGYRAKPWPVVGNRDISADNATNHDTGSVDVLYFRGIKNLDASIEWVCVFRSPFESVVLL